MVHWDMKIESAIQIDAPIETVWALTIDVEAWPALTPYMTSVTRLDAGDLRPGSQARIVQPGQRPKVWTVEERTAPSHFRWSTRLLWLDMTATHDLVTTSEGTRNTLGIALDGWGSGLVGSLMRPLVLKALRAENAGFKRAAEERSERGVEPATTAGS